jgi:hypothetical protein
MDLRVVVDFDRRALSNLSRSAQDRQYGRQRLYVHGPAARVAAAGNARGPVGFPTGPRNLYKEIVSY